MDFIAGLADEFKKVLEFGIEYTWVLQAFLINAYFELLCEEVV